MNCSEQHKYVVLYCKCDPLPVVSYAQPVDFPVLRDSQYVLCHEAFGIHLNSYSKFRHVHILCTVFICQGFSC